jgi:DinB superfamily
MGMTSLSASLAASRNELNANTSRLHALVDTMDDATWRARPSADRWSVAECIEHLNLTSRAYVPVLRDALRDGRARGLTNPAASNRVDLFGWLLVKSMEPPVRRRRRMKTPAPFVPPAIEPRERAVSEYEALQQALIGVLTEAEGLAISKIKLRSPFNARIRYSVYSALRIITAHQRRHLWQAEQTRAALRASAR